MAKQETAVSSVEALKRQKKSAKKAPKEVAVAEVCPAAVEEAVEAAPTMDKAARIAARKAKNKAAKEAAAATEAAPAAEEVNEAEAKKPKKARLAEETEAPQEADADVTETVVKRQKKKGSKKAAEQAVVAHTEEAPKTPKRKRAAEDREDGEEEEKPKKKKGKKVSDHAAQEAGEESEVKPKSEAKQEDRSNDLTAFIRGLPFSVTEDLLGKDFTECGEIEKVTLPISDGRSRGIAFIKFSTQEGFDAALKYDNTDYGGRTIFVAKAGDGGKGKGKEGKDGGGKGKSNDNEFTVFLRGLPFSVAEDSLTKDFAECGEIEKLNLPLNEEGKPRGIAFIKYKTQEAVDAALKFDDTEYGGRTIYVSLAGGAGKGNDGKGKKGKDSKGKDGKGKSKGKGKGKA